MEGRTNFDPQQDSFFRRYQWPKLEKLILNGWKAPINFGLSFPNLRFLKLISINYNDSIIVNPDPNCKSNFKSIFSKENFPSLQKLYWIHKQGKSYSKF